MKSKIIFSVALVLVLFSFSNCALHNGYMQSSANLSSNNFNYIKRDVQGSASCFYILGIGGNNKSALVNDAKQNLLHNFQLQANQALVDITLNWKTTHYLLAMKQECTITASVVEFTK